MPTPATTAGAGRREARWTREAIIEKIQEWNALYGEPPRAADWNPSSAKWSGATWRIARYRAGDWPSLNAAKRPFGGSLNAAITAAGLSPNKSGPPSRRSVATPDVDRVEMPPEARTLLRAREAEIRALQERVETRDRQLDRSRDISARLRDEMAEVRADAAAARRETRPVTKTMTKTRVERVRVKDGRAERKVERLEAKLADAEAVARAERDRAQASDRAVRNLENGVGVLRHELTDAQAELARALGDKDALADRLAAAQAIEPVVIDTANEDEVKAARRVAHDAEVRAARAERKMRELEALVTGGERRLTKDEVNALKKGGASGPGVLMAAVKGVAEARAKAPATLPAALTKLASAAIRWRESL